MNLTCLANLPYMFDGVLYRTMDQCFNMALWTIVFAFTFLDPSPFQDILFNFNLMWFYLSFGFVINFQWTTNRLVFRLLGILVQNVFGTPWTEVAFEWFLLNIQRMDFFFFLFILNTRLDIFFCSCWVDMYWGLSSTN